MTFAVVLPSKKAADIRLSFHRSTKGKDLATKLKSATGGKLSTFGIAGSEGLAEDVEPEAGIATGTLVLYLEGKVVTGLAKRLRGMLKELKVGVFTKVRVLKDGKELDSAAEGDPEVDVETLDLSEDDEDATAIEEPGSGGEGLPQPGRRKVALTLRLREVAGFVLTLPEAARDTAAKLARQAGGLLREAGDSDDDPALGTAERVIAALEERFLGQGADNGGSTGNRGNTGGTTAPEEPAPGQMRGEEAQAEVTARIVDFAKARLLWAKSRQKLQADMRSLAARIVELCGDDPEFSDWKSEAPSLIDLAAEFDNELEMLLEEVDAAPDIKTKKPLLDEAIELLASYSAQIDSEFWSLIERDTSVATVEVGVVRSALAAIGKMVQKGQEEAA